MDETSNSKFVTRKWNIVNDQSNANYDAGCEIIYNTEVLKSNLFGFNDPYILVKRNITIAGHNLATDIAFKNCATFTKCITKTDGIAIDDAEDLDLVMSMYILIEYRYSSNYPETTGSLWFYSKDETTNFNADIGNNNNLADGDNGILKKAAIAVPLKYLSNFWRPLKFH